MNAAAVGTIITALLNAGYSVEVIQIGDDGQGNKNYRVIASGAPVTAAQLNSFAQTYNVTANTSSADFL